MPEMKFHVAAEGGRLPQRATPGSAGLDCFARVGASIAPGQTAVVPLGFSAEIPRGWYLEMRPRSGKSKDGLHGSGGTIDRDFYPREISAILHNSTRKTITIQPGENVVQARPERDHLEEATAILDCVPMDMGCLTILPEEVLRPRLAARTGGFGSTDG